MYIQVHTVSGQVYEGIFNTVDREGQLVLSMVHELNSLQQNSQDETSEESLVDGARLVEHMIFPLDIIVQFSTANIEMESTRGEVPPADDNNNILEWGLILRVVESHFITALLNYI